MRVEIRTDSVLAYKNDLVSLFEPDFNVIEGLVKFITLFSRLNYLRSQQVYIYINSFNKPRRDNTIRGLREFHGDPCWGGGYAVSELGSWHASAISCSISSTWIIFEMAGYLRGAYIFTLRRNHFFSEDGR